MKMKNFVRLMIDFSLFGIAPADLNKEADVKCMLFFFFLMMITRGKCTA